MKRRAYPPYGLSGGGPGQRGKNTWIKQAREEDGDLRPHSTFSPSSTFPPSPPSSTSSTETANGEKENAGKKVERVQPPPRVINIGGKASVRMGRGDHLIIETPGGGAWGAPLAANAVSPGNGVSQGKGVSEGRGVEGGKGEGGEDVSEVAQKIRWAARGSLAEREAVQAGF